jgi:hypothetical protein
MITFLAPRLTSLNELDNEAERSEAKPGHNQNRDPIRGRKTDDRFFGHDLLLGSGPLFTWGAAPPVLHLTGIEGMVSPYQYRVKPFISKPFVWL